MFLQEHSVTSVDDVMHALVTFGEKPVAVHQINPAHSAVRFAAQFGNSVVHTPDALHITCDDGIVSIGERALLVRRQGSRA